MPGLLRGVVRTAAIAGTATAVSNHVSRRQAESLAATGDLPLRPATARPTGAGPGVRGCAQPAPAPDPIQQLKDLAELGDQGVLTEEEFAVQKSRILNT